jgi:CHAT domain-containing protein
MVCNNRKNKPGSQFMGMALSDISLENKAGLPGTEDELRKILPLFKENISTFGKQSTETFAKKNAGNYDFIHFDLFAPIEMTPATIRLPLPIFSCSLSKHGY